ncbi:MAG: DUF1538 domain-containing protein [Oscillospiraceae bacterium]|nr:DUF1538 domain-containing protein [Oscillospiraceae bacterium]
MTHDKLLIEKLQESINSILPITAIVAAVSFLFIPIPSGLMLAFLLGAVHMILGMGMFSVGAELSMSKIGGHIGGAMTASRKLWLILVTSFVLGTAITLAEPDLQVLAANVPGISTPVLLLTVGVGVGLFLALAMLRILLAVSLRTLLLILYAGVFLMAFFLDADMLPLSFDAGGVTTGPMTVPFIMALGVGVSAIRSDEKAKEDSFGLVSLCSVGPVFAVMLLSLIYRAEGGEASAAVLPAYADTVAVGGGYLGAFPAYFKEVALALLPIFAFFLLFQVIRLHLRRQPFFQILVGIVYAYVGLVLFLTGVNVGFSPLGEKLGELMALGRGRLLTVPLSMLMGWFIIRAEPAVKVLTKQVEEITAGAVSERAMEMSLSLAVAAGNALAMLRVLTGIPILYFLIPGYAAALLMSFFVPATFTGIAFDSGGVASGPLTATFMLLFAMGASRALGSDVMRDAFGLVSMVAMMPLITVQGMGMVFVLRSRGRAPAAQPELHAGGDEIIELWEIA